MRSLIANRIKHHREKENIGKKNEDYFGNLRNHVSRPPLQKNDNLLNKSASDTRNSYSNISRKHELISTATDLSSKSNAEDTYNLKKMVKRVYEKRSNGGRTDFETDQDRTSKFK
jgi:hypothetical protein